jgi:hypothetical protein
MTQKFAFSEVSRRRSQSNTGSATITVSSRPKTASAKLIGIRSGTEKSSTAYRASVNATVATAASHDRLNIARNRFPCLRIGDSPCSGMIIHEDNARNPHSLTFCLELLINHGATICSVFYGQMAKVIGKPAAPALQ